MIHQDTVTIMRDAMTKLALRLTRDKPAAIESPEAATSLGAAIPAMLEARGIDTVFGIPGVHTIELYRGLAATRLRHVTPRHEQGAGFMADGYARATGRPAACFVVTGPGLLNTLTAMGQALADSIPMLVIATLNPRASLERGEGQLHELRGQSIVGRELARFHQTVIVADQLAPALDEAFALFASTRPGPVLIEVPIDLLAEPYAPPIGVLSRPRRVRPDELQVIEAAEMLNAAQKPLVILGGGAVPGAESARRLIEALDAPTLSTANAKGILPMGHPLEAGGCKLTPTLRARIEAADVVLAIGTELSDTNFWYAGRPLDLQGALIRVDIDSGQLDGNARARLPILSDASAFAQALLPLIVRRPRDGATRAASIKRDGEVGMDMRYARHKPLLDRIWKILPEAIVTADATGLSFAGNHVVAPPAPRRWMSAATGFATLGYALPAAIGAKIARPKAPVICIAGDGAFHFTLPELAAAADAQTPIIILLWNDASYGEIAFHMERGKVEPVGVALYPTDFSAIATAFGARHVMANTLADVETALLEAAKRTTSTIIEMNAHRFGEGD